MINKSKLRVTSVFVVASLFSVFLSGIFVPNAFAATTTYNYAKNQASASGTMIASTCSPSPCSITVKTNTFTWTNHLFGHWNTTTTDTGTSYANGAVIASASGTATLNAIWTAAAPTGVTGTSDNTQSTVSWTAGTAGTTATTAYTVTSSPGGFTCTTASTSCAVTGLTNGTSYTFTVVATNSAGNSSASIASSGIVPIALPAPTINSITAGNAQLSVAFTAGSQTGSAITTYQYSTDGGLNWLTRQTGTNRLRHW